MNNMKTVFICAINGLFSKLIGNSEKMENIRNTYKSISAGNIKLDLVGLIGIIPSSTAYKLNIACPPHSIWPPPCYMGIGMNAYLQDSERSPQWRSDAYLITNGYQFNVENQKTKAWLSMIPDSGPGKLCEIEINEKNEHTKFSVLSLLSYAMPVAALTPGAVFGGIAGIVVATSMITAGISGMLFSYNREKYDWVGRLGDKTKMRLLVFSPEDKWYIIEGNNEDIKSVTAGSAVSRSTKKTFLLEWIFKISILTVAISAANAAFLVQVGLVIAYITNTAICQLMIYESANSIVINNRKCVCTVSNEYNSKQDMLDYVERNNKFGNDMVGWRQYLKLTNKL